MTSTMLDTLGRVRARRGEGHLGVQGHRQTRTAQLVGSVTTVIGLQFGASCRRGAHRERVRGRASAVHRRLHPSRTPMVQGIVPHRVVFVLVNLAAYCCTRPRSAHQVMSPGRARAQSDLDRRTRPTDLHEKPDNQWPRWRTGRQPGGAGEPRLYRDPGVRRGVRHTSCLRLIETDMPTLPVAERGAWFGPTSWAWTSSAKIVGARVSLTVHLAVSIA